MLDLSRSTALAWALALPLALAPAARAQNTAPTDAQIAAIVVTANQVDIDAGRLAEGKAHAASVKQFAKLMVTDHTNVNNAAKALVKKLGVTAEDNPTAQGLKKGGDDNLANLRKLDGAAFDKAYVDHEVAYHEAVIDALDKTLVPSASNAELKALLQKARPTFEAHLEHARQLQGDLGKSGG